MTNPLSNLAIEQIKYLPLSFAQERIWLHQQMAPELPLFNETIVVTIEDNLNVSLLEKSIHEIMKRYDILRTSFELSNGQLFQTIKKEHLFSLKIIDLKYFSQDRREQKTIELATDQTNKYFALSEAPLIRFTLIQLKEDQYKLLITLHHLIMDKISLSTTLIEVLEFTYNKLISEQLVSNYESIKQYHDFAIWERQDYLDNDQTESMNYWHKKLANLPFLHLPTTYHRPFHMTFEGKRYHFSFSEKLTRALKSLSTRENITYFVTLLATFNLLLSRYTGQEDIAIGSLIKKTCSPETKKIIGNFSDFIILRNEIPDDSRFIHLLQQINKNTLEAFKYHTTPIQEILNIVKRQSSPPMHQPVQVMFNVTSQSTNHFLKWKLSPFDIDLETTKFDLTFELNETEDMTTGYVEYNTRLFDETYIKRLIKHFETLLDNIAHFPESSINKLSLLTQEENDLLSFHLHQGENKNYSYKTIQQLFEEQVEKTPDNISVQFEDQILTYRELNKKANKVAHYLRRHGIKANHSVAIYMERSLEMIIGILGILKAGGIYVPLNTSSSQTQIDYILKDISASVILTQSLLHQNLETTAVPIIELDDDWHMIEKEVSYNPNSFSIPDDTIYIIYTSGSTGDPKGVMNKHKSICNRLLWMQDFFQLTEEDKILQKTPFTFDVSAWEFFWPLITGASLIFAKPEGHKDSNYLKQTIIDYDITTIHFVPSMLQQFLLQEAPEECCSLKRVICSGEILPYSLQKRFFEKIKNVPLYNLYGPTEAAIDVTVWKCEDNTEHQAHTVPIGRPITNIQTYIADDKFNFVPPGFIGMLYLGGIGLARGYLNRPEKNREKFIPNPLTNDPKSLLYKTGDLARWLPDGSIELIGRANTQQVKIHGFKIDLTEIEASLLNHPFVQECVVISKKDELDNDQLIAYLTLSSKSNNDISDLDIIYDFIKQYLPDYMIPARLIVLDHFPRMINGKTDRPSLFELIPLQKKNDIADPINPIEKTLANIWSIILNIEDISIYDNFFELGGYSFLAIQALLKINQHFKTDIKIQDFFEAPTIAKLENKIR